MTSAPRTPPEFIEWLVERHADLGPILDEHVADNGELLSHVFFGDVTRYAAALARRAATDGGAARELALLLDDLDAAMLSAADDDPVDNLIWVSFIENAQGVAGDPDRKLREQIRVRPNLAHALSHFE